MQIAKYDSWNRFVRVAFWIVGTVTGGILAYTTRFYFTFGDALAYNERGYNLLRGDWSALINHTEGPTYPFLLGIGHVVLNTNPVNEIPLLKSVNFGIFVLAMGACDLLVFFLNRELKRFAVGGERSLPQPLFSALVYSMFLFTALGLIRIRCTTPDLLILSVVCLCTGLVMWVREEPVKYSRYGLLGATIGVGYLVKSFILVFSPVWLVLAALCAKSLRIAIPRVLVAALAMILVSGPLIAALSVKAGRLSYADVGAINYAKLVSGTGKEIRPVVLHEKPKTSLFEWEVDCTRPLAYDWAYWCDGLKPSFDLNAQAKVVFRNTVQVLLMADWLWVVVIVYLLLCMIGSARVGGMRPVSMFWVLLLTGLAGILLYCLVYVDIRLIAPYLFLSLVALPLSVRYSRNRLKSKVIVVTASAAFFILCLSLLAHTAIDQSFRTLYSSDSKPSYREGFLEEVTVKDFVLTNGLKKGDRVALFFLTPGYWARMAGLRVRAEVHDEEEFLKSRPEDREGVSKALKENRIKALVARNPGFGQLAGEGWKHVEGTRDFFALFFE